MVNPSSLYRRVVLILCATLFSFNVFAQQATVASEPAPANPAEWVKAAERVNGTFSSYLALGIRLGLDAREQLKAGPHELDITYIDGPASPCACAVDGLMIATSASLGQGTLRVSPDHAAPGLLAEIIIKNRQTGSALRYRVPATLTQQLEAWNRELDPNSRYVAMMRVPAIVLFDRLPVE